MFKRDMIWRLCASLLLAVLAVMAIASPQNRTTVVTDKDDYAPGSTATITGHGWYPNATVTVQVVHTEGRSNASRGHQPFRVKTDAHGDFTATWYVDPSDSLGALFLMSADSHPAGMPKLHAEHRFIDKSSTTTVITSNSNPSTFGGSVTFSILVTGSTSANPAGTVDISDNGTSIATVTLSPQSTNQAVGSYTTSTLTGGSHPLVATYPGDSQYKPSTSTTLTQVVNKANTTTAVVSSQNPAITGANVTFTATVTGVGGAAAPSGTVTFKDGAATLGTGALSGGVATFSTTTLTAGSHSITAAYGADTNYNASTSSTLTEVINAPTATTTALVSSQNPANEGVSVTFTATVTGGATPTGTVTFKDGASTLGTGTLNGSGVAAFNTSSLLAGTHSITAVYGGDGTHSASTSSAVSQIITGNTTTTVASNHNPSVFGQSVTFTATITSSAGTPTGTVTFKDGATTLGTGAVTGGTTATFNTASLSVATHSITAVYGGDSSYNGSTSSALSQVTNQGATTTTVASNNNPSIQGQSVTFTATVAVTSPAAGSPSGTVTFKDGVSTLGTGAISGTTATFASSSLSSGAHSISAAYGGDTNFSSSTSSTLTQTVNSSTTTTAVTSNHNPSVFGQSVTLTATVTTTAGTATGTVTFKDGATTIGTGTLSANVATLSTAALSVSTHSITAVYGGDSTYTGSTSSALSQVVNLGGTTTSVASSLNPSFTGQNVTFTATVSVTSPAAGSPTGVVTFKDGATTLGTGTLSGTTATFATSALANGAHSITAVYGGDVNFATSTSATLTQTVNSTATTTAVASNHNPSVNGQSVTFTATVTTSSGTATGIVTFMDGATTLGTGTLSAGSATFTTSTLSVATHSITGVYGGDSTYQGSTSSILSQVVNKGSATTTVASSNNPSYINQAVTFTATVAVTAPATGSPTGTVTFKDGATTLGTGALSGTTATFLTSALAVGSHSITAVYGGDSSFSTSTSSILTQTINDNTTTLTNGSSLNPSIYLQSVTFTARLTDSGGTKITGATISFRDNGVQIGTGVTNPGGNAAFSTSALTAGTHPITAFFAGNLPSQGSSTSAVVSQVVNKATATVTISNTTQTYDGSPKSVTTATTPAGLTVNVTYNGSSTAPTNAGSYAVVATISDANYQGTSTGTLTINKAAATLTLGNLSVTYNGSQQSVTVTTTPSGMQAEVSFTYGGSSTAPTNAGGYAVVATLTDVNYTGTASGTFVIAQVTPTVNVAGGTFPYDGNAHPATGSVIGLGGANLGSPTFTYTPGGPSAPVTPGTYSVTGSYAGNTNYSAATGSGSITISKGNQTITFGAIPDHTYGDAAFALGATASSNLTVSYSVVSGPATVAGNTVTLTGAGSVTIQAAQAGDANYNAATPVSETFNVAKATPTVNAAGVTATYDGNPHPATGTVNGVGGASLGAPSFAYTPGGSSAPVNAGTYSAIGSFAGDINYNSASSSPVTVTINKAVATLTLSNTTQTYSGSPEPVTVTTSPSGLSGITVTYNGSSTVPTNAGTYAVDASLSDPNYTATDATGTLTIDKAHATLSLGTLAATYDGSPKAVTVTTNPASLTTVAITYGGSATPPTNAGSYAIDASLSNPNYDATDATGTLVIAKADQTINFAALPNKHFGDADEALSATATSSLAVTFAATAPATVSGTAMSFPATGTTSVSITVTASQAGDSNHNAVPDVTQTFQLLENTKPTSTAVAAPPPNAAGWNKTAVDVTVSATDNTGGDGVKEIHYTVDGGSETIVPGPSADVNLTTDGVHAVAFHSVDNAGNAEDSQTITVKIDQTAPTITANPSRPADSNGWYTSPFDVTFTADDGSGSGVDTSTVTPPIHFAGPDSKTASVTADATDKAGNQAHTVFNFKYDATAPVILVTGLSGTTHESLVFDVSATDSGSGANITLQTSLKKDGAVVWTWSGTSTAPAAPEQSISGVANDGTYHLDVTATDEAGNASTQAYDFIIDNQAPDIEFLAGSPADGGVYNTPQTISYTITSAAGIASTVETLLSQIASVDIGPAALTSGTTVSQEGKYTVHLAATDSLGHQAQLNRSFTIDLTAPTVNDAQVSGTLAPNPTWFESNVNVTLSATDPQIRTTPTPINGSGVQSIQYFATGAQPMGTSRSPIVVSGGSAAFTINLEGITTITYWAVDAAGNAAQPKTVNVQYDKTAPTFAAMSDITTTATKSTGADVSFTLPTPTDNVDPNPTIAASPVSGSTFGVGTTTVTVTATDAAGQFSSQTFNVIVNNPASTLTSITPDTKNYGDAAFTMDVTGTLFMPTSVVKLDGADRATTFQSQTGLQVAIPASDMLLAGTHNVTVFTPTPGGGTTSSVVFTVNKASQTITFASIADHTYGDAPFTVSPTSDSGLPVTLVVTSGPATVAGTTITITGAGAVTITASQAGDANHTSAVSVPQSFNVAKAKPTVNVTGGNFPYDAQPHPAIASATGVFGEDLGTVTVTYTPGGSTAPTTAGTYSAQASFAGDSNYIAGTANASISIGKSDQTISFGSIPAHTYGDVAFDLSGTATSNLAVSFSIVSGPASLSGNALTITGAGTVVIRASQAGDANFNAAPNVDQTFTVAKAGAIVHVTGGNFIYDGSPHPATGSVNGVNSEDLGSPTFTYTSGGSTVPVAAGTYSVSADFAGNANYGPASATASIVISKADQTITFGAIPDHTFGDAPFALSATASSNLAVSFSIASGPAILSGNTITITGAGTVVVQAAQAGDSNFNAAPSVSLSFNVSKATPTVNVTGGTFPYDGNPHAAKATVTGVGGADLGAATITYTPGGSTSPTNAGTYSANGSFPGDTNYNAASGSATIQIDKATATIALSNLAATYDGNPHSATATTTPPSLPGVSITYDGSATAPTAAGSYAVVATLNDPNYTATPANDTLVIAKATATVTVTGGTFPYDGAPHAATATAKGVSGEDLGAVTLDYTPGGTAAPVNAGTYTASGSFAGNANYAPATGSATVTITKASATIQISGGTFTYDGNGHSAAVTTTPSGLGVMVTYNGIATLPVHAGSYAVVATLTDPNYTGSPANDTLVITKADPAVQVTGGTFPYDGNPHPATGSVSGVGGANLGSPTFSYTPGGSTAPVNPGTYTATGSYAGDTDYNSGSSSATIQINATSQTISFPAIADHTFGDAPFALSATATSGLPVSFSVLSGPATVSGTTLTITGAGSVTVRASQPGNGIYTAAPDVDVTFNVAKATPTLTVNGGTFPYDGNPHAATASVTGVGGADLGTATIAYAPGPGTPVNAGTYTANGSFAGDANYNSATGSGTVTINQASATIALSNLSYTYDGTPKSATATTTPSGLTSVSITYDGSATAPTNAGSYAVVASLSNPNYTAPNATGTLVIAKATPTVSVTDGTFPYDGNPHTATGTVTGVGGANLGTPTFTYAPGGATAPSAVGDYTATGSFAGDANYTAATGTAAIHITSGSATITLSNLSATFDGTPHAATATTSPAGLSGVSITYDGSATAPTNAGSYAVVASLSNPNYTAANSTGTLVIAKATAAVSVTGGTFPYDGNPHAATGTVTGAGGANLGTPTFAYAPGGAAAPSAVGDYTATGSFAGDANYNASTGTAAIHIASGSATITLSNLSATYDGTPHSATATTNPAGLNTVSITYDGSPTPPTTSGSYAVVASLSNPNYTAANATGTLVIAKATPTVSVTGGTFPYDGNPHPATGTVTGVRGANLGTPTFTYAPGGATAPSAVGDYTATGSFAGDANYTASTGTAAIHITSGSATITLSNLSATFDGTPHAATATTSPAGLSGVSITYDGSATAPTNAGSYAVVANLSNPNYTAANATGTLVIARADPTVNVIGGTFPYDGNPHPATGSVTGVGGANLGTPALTYAPGGASAPVNVGSYTATGSYAGSANYNSATGTASITISGGTATLTLSNLNQTYTGSGLSATATTSPAGLGVVSVTYNGSATLPVNAGSYAVVATLTNANYTASPASGTLVIGKANATLAVAAVHVTYDGNPHGTSGTATGVQAENLGALTMSYAPGGASAPVNAGTYTATGTFAGTANYNSGTAPNTVQIDGASQTITFAGPGNQTFGVAPITLSATASSGLPVSFSLFSGPATVSGNTLTITGAGTVVIQASQAGNGNYAAAANVNVSITVAKATPTVTVTGGTFPYDGSQHPASGSVTGVGGANLGLAVITYAPGGATAPTAVGTYTVTGSFASTTNYNAATGTGTVTITSATATLTLGNLNQTYTGSGLSATVTTSPAGLGVVSVTYNGSATLPVNAGSYAVVATLTNANYAASPASGTLVIGKANATLAVAAVHVTYDGNPHGTSGTASGVQAENLGALTMTYAPGGASAPVNAGTYTATGTFAGTANYNSGTATNTVQIDGASQTITFTGPGNQTFGVAPVTLSATASSGLPVSFAVTSGPATISGNTLTIVAAGSVVVQASQAGGGNYSAATSVSVTITVAKATPTVAVTGGSFTFDGNPHPATGSVTGVGGANLGNPTFTYAPGGSTAPTAVGTYTATGSFAGSSNYNAATGTATITITNTPATLTLSNLNQTYTGLGIAATVTTSPAGLSGVSVTYNGSATLPVHAGSYSVVATLTNPNYTASPASGTLVIAKANATLTVGSLTVVYNGNPHPVTGTAVGVQSENLGALTVTYAPGGSSVPTNAGTYTATGAFAGTADYNAGSANGTVQINQATQTVTFAGPGNQTFGVAPITLSATASSSLPVTFSVVSGPASVSGTTLTINGAGNVVISAAQAGNGNWFAASTSVTITVAKATPTIVVTGGTYNYDGNPHPATGSVTGVGGANLGAPTFTYNPGGSTIPVASGTYQVTGSFAATANYNSVSGTATITINGTAATLTLSNLNQTYTGNGISATVTTAPAGLSGVSVTYNGSATLPVHAGSYAVVATLNNAGYVASPVSGTLVIAKANATLTVVSQTLVYNATHQGTTGTAVGVKGESLGALTITYTTADGLAPIHLGSYNVAGDFAGTADYNSGTAFGTIVITSRPMTVTANSFTKFVNAPDPTFTGTMVGAIPSDGITGVYGVNGASTIMAGKYPIYPNVNDPNGKIHNYTVTLVNGTLSTVYNGNSGILLPIKADGTSVFAKGAVIPVKFNVFDVNKAPVTYNSIVNSLTQMQTISGAGTINSTGTNAAATTVFLWDGTEWYLNLSTASLAANNTYVYNIYLNDGTFISFKFGLK